MLSENTVTKSEFRKMVFEKTKHLATKYHTFNVINILLEELGHDLYENKSKIKIKNFCTIQLIKRSPRKYWSVLEQKVVESKGNYGVIFNMFAPIKKIIYSNVDIDSL